MKYLLDTHVLLWWLADSESLNSPAREAISSRSNVVFVSAVSLWEIVIKQKLGKLELPPDWATTLSEESFSRLPIRWEHALAVRDLPDLHRDPFDRLLLAQCATEDLTLITHDRQLFQYGQRFLET